MELELSIAVKDTGEVSVERLPIQDRVVLGRGPESPVALDGPLISREHIAFVREGNRLAVEDLSSNGSWLNGQQLAPGKRYPVTEADRVQVPGYEFRCVLLGAEPEQAALPAAEAPAALVKGFLASITATETTVLLVFVAAVTIAAVFYQL